MVVHFAWDGKLCTELTIKLGNPQVTRGYVEQNFVYDVQRSLAKQNFFGTMEIITKRVNWLASKDMIDWHNYRNVHQEF